MAHLYLSTYDARTKTADKTRIATIIINIIVCARYTQANKHDSLPLMIKNRRHIICCLAVLTLATAFSGPSRADTRLPLVSPWEAPQTNDRLLLGSALPPDRSTTRTAENKAVPNAPVLTPQNTESLIKGLDSEEKPAPSALEENYAHRIVDELEQFGYDLFGTVVPLNQNNQAALSPSGAVQDDFILNSGDKLTVTFRGQRDDSGTYTINNQGFLIIDDLPPLMAAGMPIAQIRRELEEQIKPLHNTSVYVSLDSVRQIGVLAGGLTDQGYPSGAIFSRASERKAEEARFRMQAQDLEIKLAAALEQKDEPDATQIAAVQQLIDQLRQAQAVGRITVETDPGALTAQPELDMLLETGDRLYIPKRPLMVRVAGEVLSPAALQFRKSKDPRDYIMEAGGFTYHADKDRAFVLYPGGSAQPLLVNNWNHKAIFIPPGSTIVIPRDPKPFDFLQTARDLSQIIANLAITGIWLDDLGTN